MWSCLFPAAGVGVVQQEDQTPPTHGGNYRNGNAPFVPPFAAVALDDADDDALQALIEYATTQHARHARASDAVALSPRLLAGTEVTVSSTANGAMDTPACGSTSLPCRTFSYAVAKWMANYSMYSALRLTAGRYGADSCGAVADKPLTVHGDGSASTVVDCGNTGRFLVATDSVDLSGFTVVNASATVIGSTWWLGVCTRARVGRRGGCREGNPALCYLLGGQIFAVRLPKTLVHPYV